MKIRKTISLILLAAFLLGSLSLMAQDQNDLKVRYAKGTREIESRVLLHQTPTTRGVQTIKITEALLQGFKPDYVEFLLNGELVFIDTAPPFEAKIDTGNRIKKHDFLVLGFKEKSLKPQKIVDEKSGKVLPEKQLADSFEINIINPTQGGYVVGRTPIEVQAEFKDDSRLESVQIYVDGKLVHTMTQEPWTYIYDFGRSFNARRISVVAYDVFGRKATAAVQTSELERSTVFLETRVVTLDITATDDRGKFLGGLKAEDFEVYDNGQLQNIQYFSTEERPIWVAILIDTSGSMHGGKIRRSVFAAQQFVSQLKPQDHAMVMTFGPDAAVVSEFTNDFDTLIDDIGKVDAIRDALTPMHQALYQAMEQFKDRVGRRAIIVISDGADTASAITPDQVHEAAKHADVRIYPIAIQGMGMASGRSFNDDPSAYVMRGLADVTGGDSYFPLSSSEFLRIFKTIAEELRSQYSVGYKAPESRGNAWREIEVKIKNGGIARTKKGYYPEDQ